DGGMVSVPLPAAELEALLPAGVVVACENAPKLSVASGTRAGLAQLTEALAERGIEAQPIRIRIAAHSPLLEPILAEFRAYLRSVRLSAPSIPIVSNVTGEQLRDDEAVDPEYWVRHLRSCVRFARGIAWLEQSDVHVHRVYLEVGPGRALGALVRQCAADQQPVASLRRPDEALDDASFFAGALGRLWASGLPVELGALLPEQAARVALPAYAFDHKPYFITPGERAAASGKRSAELPDWLYRGVWRWRELEPEERAAATGQTCLVFADRLGVADQVGRQLRALGQRVVFVRKSGAYGQTDLFEYEVAQHAPHGYATLVQELAASEKLPDRILHLWCLDALAAENGEESYDAARREAAFDSVFHLARALAAEGVSKDVQLLVFTSGSQRVLAEPLPNPEHALAHGLCRVIARELPGVRASAVDLPLPRRRSSRWGVPSVQNQGELSAAVFAEAQLARVAGSIAYREGRRFELALTPAPAPPSAGSGRLRERGVYAITGGFGGIGLTLAKYLAQQYHARLVLIGRKLPRDADQLRAEIEALGGELELGGADVTELAAVRAVFERARLRFGRVHGVFHAAGVLDDALLAQKSLADAERVLRPKLEGTWVLHRAAREVDAELLVLFSSTSAWIAPPGQADYVAANAFLNAYAESRQGLPGPRTIALQWGVWRDVGMAVAALAGPKPAADGGLILASTHSAAQHWWLDEHRLSGGVPLMPGTGFLQLMAASAAELGVRSAFELCDADFVLPLVAEQPVRVELCATPVNGGQQLEIRSAAGSHALARLAALESPPPEPLDLASLRARCGARVLDVPEGS
ncbi:MAG TPA: SDR family NAD(P)-dependent oxidoreductase, partial [Polyangiales bacterium]|nr:SDR family NAD(P)-dependent oxidoreductase [Polyangiales bacterium]